MTYNVKAYYKHEHGDAPLVITTPDEIDAMIDAMLTEPFRHSVAALYVRERAEGGHGNLGPELRIAIHADAKVGSLRFAGEHEGTPGVWYAASQQSDREEVFYYYMGHDEGYPHDSELPIEQVRSAAKQFLRHGGQRPAGLDWNIWPEDVA